MINKTFNFLNQKLLIVIFAFCIFLSCLSFFITYSNRIVFSSNNKYEPLKNETISYDCEKFNIFINYPTTQNKKVNEKIKNFVISKFNEVESDTKYFIPNNMQDKFKLIIRYSTQRVNENIASFIFIIHYYNSSDFDKTEVVTLNYDLKCAKIINLNSFFEENSSYKVTLCDISKDHLLMNHDIKQKVLNYLLDDISNSSINSFDGYAFSNTHLSIYFNTNKISSKYDDIYEIKIPWVDVKHLLKKNIYYDC